MSKKILKHFKSQSRSVEDRIAEGKSLRDKLSRISHGKYKPADNLPLTMLIRMKRIIKLL